MDGRDSVSSGWQGQRQQWVAGTASAVGGGGSVPEEAVAVMEPLLDELLRDALLRDLQTVEHLEQHGGIVVESRDNHLQTHGAQLRRLHLARKPLQSEVDE